MIRMAVLPLIVCGLASGEEPNATLVRDLTRVPAGEYEMVQTYELDSSTVTERDGEAQPPEVRKLRRSFAFDVVVTPNKPEASATMTVTVRRVQIRVEGRGMTIGYDSDGPPADQTGMFRDQYQHLVGRTARVDLSEFGEGEGFSGLDEAWDQYMEENPALAAMAKVNRRICGDSTLDKMLTYGLEIPFGPDAGRASGRTRELRQGEAFHVDIQKPGVGFAPTELRHNCRVQSVTDGTITVDVEWSENGVKPETDESGVVTTRGGEIQGSTIMAFWADCGLLVAMERRVETTEQVARLPIQQTTEMSVREEFTFRRK